MPDPISASGRARRRCQNDFAVCVPDGRVLIVTSVFSAKVKGGVIVADDVELPEGATVTVTVDEHDDLKDDYAELTAEETAELEAAIAAADRGEGVPWETVRDELRRSYT